jgi:hypothetical protein
MTSHGRRLDPSHLPVEVPLRPFRTPVRGHPFAARPPGAAAPHAGQPARLRREHDNPVDPLAVAVWTRDDAGWWRVGYLDRVVAARLAPRLDDGLEVGARLDGWVAEPRGRWRRPVVLLLPDRAGQGEARGAGSASTPASPAAADRPTAADRPAPADPPRLWGRPPGVVRRPVRARPAGGGASRR